MVDKGMYLWETVYCDLKHPAIVTCANRFSGKNQAELAVAVFNHARDSVSLAADVSRVKASETLEKRYGACWNKAVLLIALLRARGIPARLARTPLDRRFLKPLFSLSYLLNGNPFYHYSVEVLLDGRWIAADSSCDTRTFETVYKKVYPDGDIRWDGKNNHSLHGAYVAGKKEIVDDIDAALNANAGNKLIPKSLAFTYRLGNMMIPWRKTGWNRVLRSRS